MLVVLYDTLKKTNSSASKSNSVAKASLLPSLLTAPLLASM